MTSPQSQGGKEQSTDGKYSVPLHVIPLSLDSWVALCFGME